MHQLADKSIIVTGATSGIGRAAAVKLAALGARLTLVGRNAERGNEVERQVRALGADARLELVDLVQTDSMQSIIARTVAEFGGVHAAVLSAGTDRTAGGRACSACSCHAGAAQRSGAAGAGTGTASRRSGRAACSRVGIRFLIGAASS